MGLTRRLFLQRTGLALTALGASDIGLSVLADRYQQALAQPTPRKLALLIGINQYPEQVCDYPPVRGSALTGCLTDVALQQELLIHRFGFHSSDILTLTDQQATRDAIESAFLNHLGEQLRSGDVAVIHFSGLGSRVRLIESDEVHNSLVPVDGVLPTAEATTINDLMEDTLGLLLRSLPTDLVTTILDLSYVDPNKALQGNWRVRSRPSTLSGQLNEAELALQETLASKLKLSPAQRRSLWTAGQLSGTVLAATDVGQGALEGQWRGFSAGLFTYALTQQLWHSTPPTTLHIDLARATATVKQFVGQEQSPCLIRKTAAKSRGATMSAYYLTPDNATNADGVVTAVAEDGRTIEVWLGGLPAAVVDYIGANSLLSVGEPSSSHLLQVRSRDGLIGKARCVDPTAVLPPVGSLVRETTRLLPRNISLVVALDGSLERIERVDATSAFAVIPRVSAVIAGEQPADYLFGKTTSAAQTLTASLTSASSSVISAATPSEPLPKGSYGLFNLGRAVIPNTLTEGDEAVKTAVNRLTPKLRTLLAAKLLRLTANSDSSRLGVRATLETVAPQERAILQQDTPRAPWSLDSRLVQISGETSVPTIPTGSKLRYRLQNYSDRPIYFTVLGLDSTGNAIALYPTNPASFNTPNELTVDGAIAPGKTLMLPQVPASEWVVNGPVGLMETYVICSRTPLAQFTLALASQVAAIGNYRLGPLPNALDAAHAILQDLHSTTAVPPIKPEAVADAYLLDVDTWATLSFVYQVSDAIA